MEKWNFLGCDTIWTPWPGWPLPSLSRPISTRRRHHPMRTLALSRTWLKMTIIDPVLFLMALPMHQMWVKIGHRSVIALLQIIVISDQVFETTVIYKKSLSAYWYRNKTGWEHFSHIPSHIYVGRNQNQCSLSHNMWDGTSWDFSHMQIPSHIIGRLF